MITAAEHIAREAVVAGGEAKARSNRKAAPATRRKTGKGGPRAAERERAARGSGAAARGGRGIAQGAAAEGPHAAGRGRGEHPGLVEGLPEPRGRAASVIPPGRADPRLAGNAARQDELATITAWIAHAEQETLDLAGAVTAKGRPAGGPSPRTATRCWA